jgi:hypothetical protein
MGQRPDSHLASNPQTKKNEAAVHQYLDTQGGMGEIGSGKLQTFKDVHADFEKKNAGHRSITPNEMQSHLESHPNWPRKEQTNEGTEMQKDIDELVEAGFSESEASKIVETWRDPEFKWDHDPGNKIGDDSDKKSSDKKKKKKDCKCGGDCKCGMKSEETQNPDDNEDWDTDRLGEDNREFFEEFHADHGHLPEAEQLELMEAFSKTLNEETYTADQVMKNVSTDPDFIHKTHHQKIHARLRKLESKGYSFGKGYTTGSKDYKTSGSEPITVVTSAHKDGKKTHIEVSHDNTYGINEETFVDRMAAQMGTLLKQSQTSPLTATSVSEAAYKAGDHVIVQSGIHHGKRGIVESTEDTTLSLKSVTDKFGARSMNIDVAVSDIRK